MQGISKVSAAKTSGTCKSMYSLSSRTDHVGVTTMRRLDQGHLHPKIVVPRLTAVGGEHSRKEPMEQLVNRYSETSTIQHMSAQPRRVLATI